MKTLFIALCLFAGVTFAQSVKPLVCDSTALTISINIGNKELLAIHDVDSTFAGSTITLYASSTEDGSYQPVNFDGTVQTYTVTKGFYFAFDPRAVANIISLKILSDGVEECTYNLIVGDTVGD